MTFETFKATRDLLDQALTAATQALKAIPGHASGPMGLTPDDVRARADWRHAKAMMDMRFAAVRKFNGTFAKRFEKERRAEVQAKREAQRG